MIQYILEVLAFQLLFLLVYDLFLKKETFFNWNRAYLIGTSLLSLLIPFVKLSIISSAIPEQYTYVFPMFEPLAEITLNADEASRFIYQFQWMHIVYVGMFISFLILLFKLYKINVLVRKGERTQFENYTKVLLMRSKQAFSFFKYIFLGDAIIDKEQDQIIEHELVHVKQKHSIDLLYFELLRVIFWFNPLIYIYQNRMAELHEFIADAQAVKSNKKAYVNELLAQAFQTQHISFVNQFLKPSLLKNRLKMISRQQSKTVFKLKYLFLVPLVLGMLIYNSCEQLDDELAGVDLSISIDDDDGALKRRLISKYEAMDFVTLHELRNNNKSFKTASPLDELVSKQKYYESRIQDIVYMKKMTEKDNIKRLIEASDGRIKFMAYAYKRGLENLSYSNYVNEHKFYQVFDKNIGISLNGFTKILIDFIDIKTNSQTKIFEAQNTTDFSGDELIQINRLLENHVKNDTKNSLIITDGINSAEFFVNPNYLEFKQLLRDEKSSARSTAKTPFAVVEQVPIFPGCENSLDQRACFREKIQNHIKKNFRYPAEAQAENVQGRVYVNFVISTDGTIEDLQMRGPDKRLESEVGRIINKLPQFIPGKQSGMFVNVPFSIPITFKLNNDKVADDSVMNYSEKRAKERDEQISKYQDKVVPFAVIDEVPVFPGCENIGSKKDCFNEKLNNHIRKHFNYPNNLKEEGIEGDVYIMFEINKSGKVDLIKARAADPRLEEAAKTIINKLPTFEPGRHKGKAVRVPYATKITYSL
ncbi:M56 family metallopeptidase [Spongiivirga citrea]|uniref:TonB family protein n=1 Tax=Spongiivirga citrea TaxID=1481457 RepID=A0A6M0CM61_9FLAO|nr:M56 family metallopeptidase [Spongiivirga citrea]NER16899.1 TonB family protein [Spongiivirga citrea]